MTPTPDPIVGVLTEHWYNAHDGACACGTPIPPALKYGVPMLNEAAYLAHVAQEVRQTLHLPAWRPNSPARHPSEGDPLEGPQIGVQDFGTYEPPACKHQRVLTYRRHDCSADGAPCMTGALWTGTLCLDCGCELSADEDAAHSDGGVRLR